ncbi:MAG: hypothetical protein ACRDTZ_03330 [Pseudonocardiaceae bacterium]
MPFDAQAAIAALRSRLDSAPRVEGSEGFAIDLRATVHEVLRAANSDALIVPRYDDAFAREARYRLLPFLSGDDEPGMTIRVTVEAGTVRTTIDGENGELMTGYTDGSAAHLLGLAYCSAAAETIGGRR